MAANIDELISSKHTALLVLNTLEAESNVIFILQIYLHVLIRELPDFCGDMKSLRLGPLLCVGKIILFRNKYSHAFSTLKINVKKLLTLSLTSF